MHIKLILLILLSIFIHTEIIFSKSIDFTRIIDSIEYQGIKNPEILKKINQYSFETKINKLPKYSEIDNESINLYKFGLFKSIEIYSKIKNNTHTLVYEFNVNPKINHIKIIGNSYFNDQTIISQLVHKKGDILNFNIVEKDKSNLLKFFENNGYNLINIKEINFNQQKKEYKIIISESIVSEIIFNGLKKNKPRYLRREMKQKVGNPFNSDFIKKDRIALLQLGYFASISSPKILIKPDQTIKLIFHVAEKKINQVNIGIEQEEREVNGFISTIRNNFIIDTDILSLKTQIKKERKNKLNFNNYTISYKQPWTLNRYQFSTALNYYNEEEENIIENNRVSFRRSGQSIRFTRPLKEYLTNSLATKIETVSPQDQNIARDSYNINSISYKLSFNNIKNKFNPTGGYYWNIIYEKGNSFGLFNLGGLTFSKTTLNYAKFKQIYKKHIFAIRVQGGIFYPNKEEVSTFDSEYFIIGGANTIRGYDESRFPFKGKRKVITNLEYRMPFFKSFQTILFLDAGNAFDQKIKTIHFGKGIGLRYITPVGPIRLDFAVGEKDYFIHFGLGQIF